MRGMGKAIASLFKVLIGLGVPKWGIALGIGLLLWWGLPKLGVGIQKDKARRILLVNRLQNEAERKKADQAALEVAGDDADALTILAAEAIREQRVDLAETALARLRKTGKHRLDLARLEEKLHGRLPKLEVEAVMRIENLLKGGLLIKAERLASRCVQHWPDNTELAALLEQSQAALAERDAAQSEAEQPDNA